MRERGKSSTMKTETLDKILSTLIFLEGLVIVITWRLLV